MKLKLASGSNRYLQQSICSAAWRQQTVVGATMPLALTAPDAGSMLARAAAVVMNSCSYLVTAVLAHPSPAPAAAAAS